MNKFVKYIENKSKPNKYLKWYVTIINTALVRVALAEKNEMHHIVPVSFESRWRKEPDNIVRLTYREHFIVHRCLAKMFEGIYHQKMIYALGMLYGKQTELRTKSSRIYSILREQYSINNIMRGTVPKKKVSDALKGRNKNTHSYIAVAAVKKSQTLLNPSGLYQTQGIKKRKKWVNSLTKEERKIILGHEVTEEQKAKLSKERLGKTAGNCERVKRMQATKKNIFSAMTAEERKLKQGHSRGTSWYFNDEIQQCKTFLPGEAPCGWLKGRKFYEKNKNS